MFWSWDTPELIAQKFEQIVNAKGLGGVMAWSLGEDSAGWKHIEAMKEGLKKSGGGGKKTGCQKKKRGTRRRHG